MKPFTGTRAFERTLLLDADDTLWENNIYYLECADRFLAFVESLGFNREMAQQALSTYEHRVIPTLGYGPEAFIEALGLTYEHLAKEEARLATPCEKDQARSIGRAVLSPPMKLLAGVEETIFRLWPTTRLILVTKGHKEHQQHKVDRSGLVSCFDAVYIVPEKDTKTFSRIIEEMKLAPKQTWMVGNSPKSDINPAIHAGLGAIFIPHEHTWMAEIQNIEHPELVTTLERFSDLLSFFKIADAAPILL